MNLLSKKTIAVAAVIVAIPILALAWWLLSPLLSSTTVEEEFPFSANAQIPDDMTQADAESVMAGMSKIVTDMTEPMPEQMEMPESTVLATGMFRDADSFHKGSGSVTLYRLPDGRGILRFENLSVTNGPDLHVLAALHPNPMGRSDVRESGYLDLGQLKGNRGNQNYEFPADVDIESFGSVVIYCLPFQVVFSVATLEEQS